MNWTKEYLKKSFQVESKTKKLHLMLDNISGDCDLNQRKGQVINIYDLAVKGSWKVKLLIFFWINEIFDLGSRCWCRDA